MWIHRALRQCDSPPPHPQILLGDVCILCAEQSVCVQAESFQSCVGCAHVSKSVCAQRTFSSKAAEAARAASSSGLITPRLSKSGPCHMMRHLHDEKQPLPCTAGGTDIWTILDCGGAWASADASSRSLEVLLPYALWCSQATSHIPRRVSQGRMEAAT